MTGPPAALALAGPDEPVRYVVIDDEPRYRQGLGPPDGTDLVQVGGYGSVEDFLHIQRQPCHVIVLDLCLNRLTGDTAVLQGVRAIRTLVTDHQQRVLVYTADERPEPVARCVAAGAAGYVSKYLGDTTVLTQAVMEIGRHGSVVTEALHNALRSLISRCRDIRLSDTLEETLVLLDRGRTDQEIAQLRVLSPRTIEDHKRKILELFGADLESQWHGFADLTHQLGVGPGGLVNDEAGQRPQRGLLKRAMPWAWPRRRDR